jgi:hypothetical protein
MARKYRQQGYQDNPDPFGPPRESGREDKRERGPRQGYGPREPRKVNMPSFREVVKCSRCGHAITPPIALDATCPSCASDLHSCAQCTWFDTGSRFECNQRVPERIMPKDTRNTCSYHEARVTVERETRTAARDVRQGDGDSDGDGGSGARQAFDDLFK